MPYFQYLRRIGTIGLCLTSCTSTEQPSGTGTELGLKCELSKDLDGNANFFKVGSIKKIGITPRAIKDGTKQKINPEDAGKYVPNPYAFRVEDGGKLLGPMDLPFQILVGQNGTNDLSSVKFEFNLREIAEGGEFPAQNGSQILPAELEKKDAKPIRKNYGAMTTLPTGHILLLGRGTDVTEDGKESVEAKAALYSPSSKSAQQFELEPFYRKLLQNKKFAPDSKLNIEGVYVRVEGKEGLIGFMNSNKETGLAVTLEFDYREWMKSLKVSIKNKTTAWDTLEPKKLVTLQMPKEQSTENFFFASDIISGSDKKTPIFWIPTQSKNKEGKNVSGIAILRFSSETGNNACEILMAPESSEPLERIEALASYNYQGKTAFERSTLTAKSLILALVAPSTEGQTSKIAVISLGQ